MLNSSIINKPLAFLKEFDQVYILLVIPLILELGNLRSIFTMLAKKRVEATNLIVLVRAKVLIKYCS
jgi:hypothetical protein